MISIDTLRLEHQQHVIGPQIAELLQRVVRATAPSYPASEYSDGSTWNPEALEDAMQEWVVARLIRRNDLTAILARSASPSALHRMLTTSFSQFLINRRPRTSASNLFKRSQIMLETHDIFLAVDAAAKPASQQWTLAAAPRFKPTELSLRELVAIAAELSDQDLEVVRYGPFSLKSSPILRKDNLRRLLNHLLAKAEGTMTLSQIAEVERRRFGLYEFELEELDDRLANSTPDLVRTVELADLASRILANLQRPVTDVLVTLAANDGKIEATADALGISRDEVGTRLRFALELIAKFAETPEDAVEVYRLLESRFVEGGDV